MAINFIAFVLHSPTDHNIDYNMSTNKSNTNSSSRQKWGRGSVSSSARRRQPPNDNLVPNNHDNEGDTENMGRELDQCTADQNVNKDMVNEYDDINTNDDDIDMFAEIGKELAQHTNTNDDLEIPRPLEEDNNNEMDIEKLSIHSGVNNDQPTSNVDLEIPRELDIPVVPAISNDNNVSNTGIPQQIQVVDTTQNINTQTSAASAQQQQSNKKQKRGANSTVKKLSPPRHSFQSSTMKQKSTVKKKSTFKTPAGSKFPSRDLFSNTMSQRSTAKKSVGNNTSTNVSTTQRKKRHSFRPSVAAAPAAPKSNVKEMRFVPTFLTNNSKTSPPKETVPIDDDNDDGDDTNNYSDKDVFAQNMVSTHHQAKQQARKSESSKSGYLVQRLRSLRNTEQRMAMKLRNSQLSSGLSGGGGGGIRKRRRTSAGNNLDPKTCSSSILDVTVSGKLPSDVDASLLGEGKSVLLAYIHQHTMTKQTSNEGEGEEGSRGVSSCYAWIVMSHDVMREQGLLDACTTTKQLRIYDSVVIPPRVVDMKTGNRSSSIDTNQTKCDMHRPTIVCTHISQAYPSDQPPLQDVSFDQFSS